MLRSSTSHAVLALAAAALLSTAAMADVDGGQTVKISTISGNTTLAGGTLQLDSGSPFSRNFTFKDASSSTIDAFGKSSVLSGKLTGKGNITFADTVGGGTVTLSNSNNDFTGTTTVNSGVTLALVDSDTGSDTNGTSGTIASSQRLINNGTFDISGAVNSISLVSLAGSGNVKLGSISLTLNDYNSTDSTTYATNTTYSGVISGTGSLLLSSGEITLTGVNTFTGSVTISSDVMHIAGSGSIASASSVLVYGTLDYTAATAPATITSLAGSGTVTLGSNDLVLTAASGAFSGTITTSGKLILNSGTQYIGGTTNTFGQGVLINGGTLQLAGSNDDLTVDYNIVNNGTLAFYNTYGVTMRNGVISGTGAVNKLGSGIATITTAQSYTGATVITGGTLKLTGTGSIASSSGVQVDSIFDLTESNAATVKALTGVGSVRLGGQSLTILNGNGDFSGSITGVGGALTITGGSQSLSGTNTYTGDTTVSGGKLILVAGSSLKSAVKLNGGNLELSQSVTSIGSATITSLVGGAASSVALGANTLILSAANGVFAGVMSGTGGLTISSGTETLSGANTYTGTTAIATGAKLILTGSLANASALNVNGTLDATGVASPALTVVSLSGSGNVNLGAHGLVVNTASNNSAAFTGVISGSVGLTVGGTGTQILSGANTYTGVTTVNSGATLQIGNGSNTGSILGDIVDNGTVRFYRQDADNVISGVIMGTGAVVQAGIGTTVLTGDNTYSGGTTISAGTLQIGDGKSASGSITGNITDNGTLAFARTGSTNIDAKISGSGNLAIKTGVIALTAASDYEGNTNIASGAELDLKNAGSIANSSHVFADGIFDIAGTTAGANIVSLGGAGAVNLGAQTLTITKGNDTFAGVINGSGGLIIAGGTQTLSGTSTYTGATSVTGGTLVVTGSIAKSAVAVKTGGTVSGTGTIGGLSVENGGTVKAGVNGAGTLSVNGALDLKTGGTYAVDVTSAGAAKLAVTGTAGLHGTLSVTSSDGTYNLGNKVTVLTAVGGIDYTGFTVPDTFTGANNKAVFKTTLDKSNANALALQIDLNQLTPALKAAGTPSVNQLHVVAGIDNAIAAGTKLSAAFQGFGNDTGAKLLSDTAQLSGEVGADASLAVRAAFSPFLDAMSQHTAMVRPLGKGESRPLETWVSAYGGSNVIAQNEGLGAHKFHSSVSGAIAGAQWAPWANVVLGGAVGVGTTDFRVNDGLGKGKATSIDAGVYGYVQASRHVYNSFAVGVSATEVKTTRALTVSGTDTLTGKQTVLSFGGRYEMGIQLPLFSPYIGVQDHLSMMPSYTEGAAKGSNATYALSYASRTVNSGRAEVGFRHYFDLDVTPRWILSPDFTLHLNDRLAYAYDLSDGTKAGVQFTNLKSSDFDVFGAKAGRHAGVASIGADVLFTNGLRFSTNVEAAVSQKSEAFTGFVGLGYRW